MANLIYPTAKKAFLDGDIDLLNDTIKIALCKTAYTYSSAHDFYDDLGANPVGTDQTLAGKSTTGGVFDATDPVWTALSSTEVSYAVIYKSTGVAGHRFRGGGRDARDLVGRDRNGDREH